MSTESLIYDITRAVYRRLGENASPALVEDLVTDVYRALQPALQAQTAHAPAEPAPANQTRAVISVFGNDGIGIAATILNVLAETRCSLVDIDQTILRGKFAMVLIADTTSADLSITALREKLEKVGEKLDVKIYVQREDLFHAMHRV